LMNDEVAVSNFAFTGYSAHQMLWQVTSGMVAHSANCDPELPVLAIYQTLPNNVGRVAGLRGWDEFGPRYALESNGAVRYAGSFADGDYVLHDRVRIPAWLAAPLSRINLYSRMWGKDRQIDAFDVARFSAIVRNAEDGLRRIYPNLQFLVVVWPEPADSDRDPASETSRLIRDLQGRGLSTLSANAIVPSFQTNPAATGIPGDGQPNAATQRLIAEYLAPIATRWIDAETKLAMTNHP
jgi:hypothetical protein